MQDSFIIVDLETTDKVVSNAQIITGCFIHCDKDLNIIDRLDIQSKPSKWDKTADQASLIHGITWDQAKKFDPWYKVGNHLASWLKSKPTSHFVCHANRSIFGQFYCFDYAVLKYNLFDLDHHWDLYKSCPESQILSTHSIAKHLDIQFGFDKLNLKSISETLGLKDFDHHDASADALKCLEILKIFLPRMNVDEFLDKEYFKTTKDTDDEDEAISTKHARRSKKLCK
jgi:DNA polymerase III alpha subunit (gram-positive type)